MNNQDSNKIVNKIILNIVETMYLTEDSEQLKRLNKMLDRFNMLIKIRGESNEN